ESTFLPFKVPKHIDSQAKIEVNGTFGSYVFGDKKEIDFQKSKTNVLVQTDKALYKPGQKVQLRVLPINNELKPVTDVQATIYVTSPGDVRIAQWNNVTFEKGIVQRDFKLSEEPELGLWQIVVELPSLTVRQHFEVNEYVLPKFEVTVKPPSYVLADAKEITWKICAHYTFGQPVDGTLKVNVTYERYSWEKDDYPRVSHEGPINGCFDMTVNTTALRFNENYEIYKRLHLITSVNETGTGITMNKTSYVSRSFNPLELTFLEGEHGKNYFKPAMPFYGSLLVKKPDGVPVGGERIQLCLLSQSEIIKPLWWRTDRRLSCKNYTSDENGLVKFTIPPMKTSVVTISVEAVAVNYETVKYDTYGVKINQPKSTLYLQAWYSSSNNFIQVEPSKVPVSCTSRHPIRVRYTAEADKEIQFHFQVMSRGKILKDAVVPVTFKADQAVVTEVDETYLVEEERNETLPSNVAEEQAATGSLEYELTPDFNYAPQVKVLVFYVRPDGEVIADAEQFEVEKCLQNNESGMVVMSDLTLETRPCRKAIYDRPPYALAAPASPPPPPAFANRVSLVGGAPAVATLDSLPEAIAVNREIPAKSAVEVRNYFPETWLWDLKELDENGQLSFKEKIPHTITEWVGSTVCINSQDGVGVSDPAKIKAFQPFFASFSLPYSVVRGELVPVKVSVFNYLEKCLPIGLTLAESEDYTIQDSASTTLCVCGSKSLTHKFLVRPKTIGEVNFTVSAAGSNSDTVCGDQKVEKVVARDAVTRPLIIEAEGFPKEETKSVFVCPKDVTEGDGKNEFDLVLPDDLVEGSARAYVSVTGDIMGPAVQNLDSLVRVPTGCGEQNMIKFTPNVYVLDYLKATGKHEEDIEKKAVENLKTGYQRQMKYRHPDGSYSAFGTSDSTGSMFLTSFVVKSFKQAEKYVPIDAANLKESIKKGSSASADIETAAYAVLTYVKLGDKENLGKAQPIVRWMATQRNSRGGFSSTQDTVLGLQALSAFATHVSKDPVDISVKVAGADVDESYDLKEPTKLVIQEKKVTNLPNKLAVETTGSGCALISTTLKYNVHTPPKSEGFELTVTPTQEPNKCNTADVKVCLR
ncbi:alpha-macroglobulin, putative, partial [Ixodes scapularis]